MVKKWIQNAEDAPGFRIWLLQHGWDLKSIESLFYFKNCPDPFLEVLCKQACRYKAHSVLNLISGYSLAIVSDAYQHRNKELLALLGILPSMQKDEFDKPPKYLPNIPFLSRAKREKNRSDYFFKDLSNQDLLDKIRIALEKKDYSSIQSLPIKHNNIICEEIISCMELNCEIIDFIGLEEDSESDAEGFTPYSFHHDESDSCFADSESEDNFIQNHP